MKIEEIEISQEEIDKIFETYDHQADVITAIYRMVYPNWDDIESIDGWPEASVGTWEYIAEKFIEFDRKHHPNVLNGGLWMNKGFAAVKNLPDFIVRQAPYEVKNE